MKESKKLNDLVAFNHAKKLYHSPTGADMMEESLVGIPSEARESVIELIVRIWIEFPAKTVTSKKEERIIVPLFSSASIVYVKFVLSKFNILI